MITIRPAAPRDAASWLWLRCALWPNGSAAEHRAEIERFFAGLGVPVIGQYDDSLLPKDQFLDTIYHLTEEAARARTQKLAAKLKSYIR